MAKQNLHPTTQELEQCQPLLVSIARDLSAAWRDLMNVRVEVEAIDRGVETAASDPKTWRDRQFDLSQELGRMVDKVNGYAAEVEQLGGQVERFSDAIFCFQVQIDGVSQTVRWSPQAGLERVEQLACPASN